MARESLKKLASRALSVADKWHHQQLRRLNIHEYQYQGAELMGKYGINVPRGVAAGSVQGIKDALKNIFPSEKEISDQKDFSSSVETLKILRKLNKGITAVGLGLYLLLILMITGYL